MLITRRCQRMFSQGVRSLLPLLVGVSLLSGCDQDTVGAEPALNVTAYEVGLAVVNREGKFHGTVVPADLTRIAFRVPGKITELAVQSGEKVLSGQVVARIEDSIARQVLADAEAQYQLSKKQLDRAKNLLDTGALTAAQKDELQAGFRLASANLELARRGLTYTLIKAPFDGTVIDVNKEVFESVSPGETVATIYRDDRIDVLVNIPDGLPSKIHQTPNSRGYHPMVKFPGKAEPVEMVHFKASTARNPKTQAFQIWLTMPAMDTAFPPGLPVTITVDLAEAGFIMDSGLIVPINALEPDAGADNFRLWRYRDGVVNPVSVRVGRISQQGAYVTRGLQAGDRIVTSKLSRLSPGQAVEIQLSNREP